MPDEVDLYKDDLATASDPDLYAAVEAFTRVASPATDRAQEGYLLDFKATWTDSALRTVAAFANTFGGLLLVGVSENHGRADQLTGIVSQRQELKTSIASSVASNISPAPAYEIRDVVFPDGSERHLCIVRVRKGTGIYLLTKKGEQPVYIRNEDESRPADAARLQALLATRSVSRQPYAEPLHIPQTLYVTHGQEILGAGEQIRSVGPGQRTRSETFLQLCLLPEEPLPVPLDLFVERHLLSIVRSAYPELATNVDDRDLNIGASFAEARTRDFYQITYTEAFRDYEMRWIAKADGAVYFVTQVRCKTQQQGKAVEAWSLADLMTNLDCTIETAHLFWDFLNYPGEARIVAQLNTESLPLLERAGGGQAAYTSGFYEKAGQRRRVKPLLTDMLSKPAKPGPRATAATNLTYATRWGSRSEPVALLTNQLLRDLGYAATLKDLQSLLA